MASYVSYKPPKPQARQLRVFAFDPGVNLDISLAIINQLTLNIPWEETEPGPISDLLEVIDIDPASGACYPPIDLNDPFVLAQNGLPPSEGVPQFHQQMVYAVSSKTIQNFETALGQKILWAPHIGRDGQPQFVQRLRIYPHAMPVKNAYYSPSKKALLFGYFSASMKDAGRNLPGGTIFTCLSKDIVTHETTHAILDALHPFFSEPSNPDVLAFHEAFADIVALFQHFSHPEIVRNQIAQTRGNLYNDNLLAQFAIQFGEATGKRGALRRYLDTDQKDTPRQLKDATEAHERGSILVAAIFEAFLTIYNTRTADLIRLATGGSGVLRPGAIHPDLTERLAREAATVAKHILDMCIRALNYIAPVDPTFGEYLRALVTADYDLNQEDTDGYRIAVIDSFRRHGIYPPRVSNLSQESLLWSTTENDEILNKFISESYLKEIQQYETKQRQAANNRQLIFDNEQKFRNQIEQLITTDLYNQYLARYHDDKTMNRELQNSINVRLAKDDEMQSIFLDPKTGRPEIKVMSIRKAYRVDSSGWPYSYLMVELAQRRRGYLDEAEQEAADKKGENLWKDESEQEGIFVFRGGVTMLIDTADGRICYVISKSIDSDNRLKIQRDFLNQKEPSMAFAGAVSNLDYLHAAQGKGGELYGLMHGTGDYEETNL